MAKMKKVILFIVEGITDQISLEAILPFYLEDEQVSFQITCGDITTRNDITPQNVIKKVNDQINIHLSRMHFRPKNIIQVVHLVDTDGAYISDDDVYYNNAANNHVSYFHDRIETIYVDKIRLRNKIKALCLNKLSSTRRISTFNYSVYYFSSNLEHVLHDTQKHLTDREKMEYAEDFSKKYEQHPEEFIDFINSKDIAVGETYCDSWEHIKLNHNSLNRFCNLHLFLKK